MAEFGGTAVIFFGFFGVWLDAVAVLPGAAEAEPAVGTAFFGELAVGAVGGACFGRIGGKRGTIEVFEQGGAVEGFRFYGCCLSGAFRRPLRPSERLPGQV